MVTNGLSLLFEYVSGHSSYGLLMETLYGASKYLAGKTIDEATKKILIEPLLKKVLPKTDENADKTPTIDKADFSDKLTDYLERNSRSVEATLRCLEQLADRLDKIDKSVSKPLFVALGLPTASKQSPQNDVYVQGILNDQTPGLPQSIKSGYALLHLRRGNRHLAGLYAHSTLRVNPVEPKAWYVLGLLKLQSGIVNISPANADEAERCLATASEAGLSAQCALPRAALRVDHYLRKSRPPPTPSLRALSNLFGTCHQEALSWPYGSLNTQLPTSPDFKRLWKGV